MKKDIYAKVNEIKCPICNWARMTGWIHFLAVKRGAASGRCHSCSLKGNNHGFQKGFSIRRGVRLTDSQKERLRLCNLGKKQSAQTIEKRVSKLRGSLNTSWKGGKPDCIFCGKKLASRYTKNQLCIQCFTKTNTGAKNPAWKGGITKESTKLRNSGKYAEWRRHVFQRDDYTCQACGIRSTKGKSVFLHADHELPFAYFPMLRLEILNGRTLCKDCHKKTPTYMGGAKKLYGITV